MMVSLMKCSYMANKLLKFVYQKLFLGEEEIIEFLVQNTCLVTTFVYLVFVFVG